MKKRLTVLLLSLIIIVAFTTGCSETSQPIETDRDEITAYEDEIADVEELQTSEATEPQSTDISVEESVHSGSKSKILVTPVETVTSNPDPDISSEDYSESNSLYDVEPTDDTGDFYSEGNEEYMKFLGTWYLTSVVQETNSSGATKTLYSANNVNMIADNPELASTTITFYSDGSFEWTTAGQSFTYPYTVKDAGFITAFIDTGDGYLSAILSTNPHNKIMIEGPQRTSFLV